MSVIVMIFLIIASIFALASLAYVAVDLILELRDEGKPREETMVVIPEPEPEPEPKPEPEPIPVALPEPVEHIDAEEADELISDEVAMEYVNFEYGAGQGKQGIINIGTIDLSFEAGSVITLADLKAHKLVSPKIGRIKILADGVLNKPLTIKAESFSIQAIKMIELTGGTVVFLKDKKEDKSANRSL